MRPHHIYLFLLLFFLPVIAFSQTFMQSAGVTFIKAKARMREPGSDYWPSMDFRGVTYFPRYNISERTQTSLSVGSPVSFGWAAGWGSSVNSFNLVFDLPVVIDYNFGHHATRNSRGIFGGYVGAGFGVTYDQYRATYDNLPDYQSKQTSYGPLARAGLKFRIPLNIGEISFTLGAFYKIGLEEERYKMRGGTFLMNF
jgi:hypothetical protein